MERAGPGLEILRTGELQRHRERETSGLKNVYQQGRTVVGSGQQLNVISIHKSMRSVSVGCLSSFTQFCLFGK